MTTHAETEHFDPSLRRADAIPEVLKEMLKELETNRGQKQGQHPPQADCEFEAAFARAVAGAGQIAIGWEAPAELECEDDLGDDWDTISENMNAPQDKRAEGATSYELMPTSMYDRQLLQVYAAEQAAKEPLIRKARRSPFGFHVPDRHISRQWLISALGVIMVVGVLMSFGWIVAKEWPKDISPMVKSMMEKAK